ncbi:MAG TPA: ComF family protein [Candidatus Acidoferrales bacterium]|nr:ComF family protein [Candidatus Acidoferrales bacterium]
MIDVGDQNSLLGRARVREALSRGFDILLNSLYPPRCRFCKRCLANQAQTFCSGCRSKIRLVSHPLCATCGRPFLDASGDSHDCSACIVRPPHFARARAWACYPRDEHEGHPLREVLQQFKYGRRVSLGKPLGRLMAEGGRDHFRDVHLERVVPVPLHPRRLRWRGFNQSLVLAREVGRAWELPVDPFALVRLKETRPQTELPEEERRRNVRQAFAVEGAKVKGESVLLVDDVYTSGATVNECARALLRAGAKEVYVFTLARTVAA